jgi:hypothetical protein
VATADALAYAGLGAEAASHYLAAAAAAPPDESIDLRARAALQHFISGQVDEGFDVLSRVLPEVGLSLPRTPGRVVLAVLLIHKPADAVRFVEREVRPDSPLGFTP